MKASVSSRALFCLLLGSGALPLASVFAQNTAPGDAAALGYGSVLGSCASKLNGAGEPKIAGIHAFALTAGTLTLKHAQVIANTRGALYCSEINNDSDCSNARKTLDCVKSTARMAREKIEELRPYFLSDGSRNNASLPSRITTLIRTLQQSQSQEKMVDILADFAPTMQEIFATNLQLKLDAEIRGTGEYTKCLSEMIDKVAAGELRGCGGFATLGTGLGVGDENDPFSQDSLFGVKKEDTSAAAKASQSAWNQAQSLTTVGRSNLTQNRSEQPLSARIRSNLSLSRGTAVPLPIKRNTGASKNPSTASSSTDTPDGILSEEQATNTPSIRVASCFPSSKTEADRAFVSDKPAFRGARTLHLYEMIHAGSEATKNMQHAVMTSPFQALVPSSKMEDDQNKVFKDAGLDIVFKPFVKIRGYCPEGAKSVTIGGSSAPRILVSLATSAYATSQKIACTPLEKPNPSAKAHSIFEARIAFTGKPGSHFFELTADSVGPGGGSLTCKEEIAIVDKTGRASYAEYLNEKDFSKSSGLRSQIRIQGTLTLDPMTGLAPEILESETPPPAPNCYHLNNECY